MMRKPYHCLRSLGTALTLLLLPSLSSSPLLAQSSENVCRIGLHYKVLGEGTNSKSIPVLTVVQPFGPAAVGGFFPGDLITQIDGVPTTGLTKQQISELLASPVGEHLLTIVRIGSGTTARILRPSCKAPYALTERELATAFSGYSPIDQAKQQRTLSFSFEAGAPFDWSQAKTFAFAPSEGEHRDLYDIVYGQIAGLLEARGLTQQASSPDLVLECSRSEAEGGARLYLRVTSPSMPNQTLWSGTSNLPKGTKEAHLYARQAIPVMLQSFPFLASSQANYTEETSRYLYTGILYDSRDLSRIVDVEEGSPAFTAGLRVGDKVLRINGKSLSPTTVGELSSRYRNFLDETYRYRSAEAVRPEQAPWKSSDYGSIRKALEKNKYASVFSYLFFFRPYINETEQTELIFEIERHGETYTLSIAPVLRDETVFIPQ